MQFLSTKIIVGGFTALLLAGCSADKESGAISSDNGKSVSIIQGAGSGLQTEQNPATYLAGQKRRAVSELSSYETKSDGTLEVQVTDLDVFVSLENTTSIRGYKTVEVLVDFTPLEVAGDPTSMFIVSSRSADGTPLPAPNFVTLNQRRTYEAGVRQQVKGVFGRDAGTGIERVLAQGAETDDLIIFVNPMRNGLGSTFILHGITITPGQ